jgi:predicted transcriptional regulator
LRKRVYITLHRAAYVVSDEKTGALLADPMRRAILNLLADNAYSQSQLSNLLGLTNASIGHHLRILSHAKLIRVQRREEEVHGIMQYFYRSIALCIVVDSERMSNSVSKYFFPINIERMRGALAVIDVKSLPLDTKFAEGIAASLAASIALEARKYGKRKTPLDRETISLQIYRSAMKRTVQLFRSSQMLRSRTARSKSDVIKRA